MFSCVDTTSLLISAVLYIVCKCTAFRFTAFRCHLFVIVSQDTRTPGQGGKVEGLSEPGGCNCFQQSLFHESIYPPIIIECKRRLEGIECTHISAPQLLFELSKFVVD